MKKKIYIGIKEFISRAFKSGRLYLALAVAFSAFVLFELYSIRKDLEELRRDTDQYISWRNREDSISVQRNVYQPIGRGQFSVRIKDMNETTEGMKFDCSILNMTSIPVSDFRIKPIMKELVYEENSYLNFQVKYLSQFESDSVMIGRVDSGKTRDFSFFVKGLRFHDISNVKWKKVTLISFWIEQHRVHPKTFERRW